MLTGPLWSPPSGGAVLGVLAEARADGEGAREGHAATDGVHHGAAGEVAEAHLAEPAATPDPVADDRVDEGGRQGGEGEEGAQPRAFGDGAVKEYVVYDSVRDRLVFSTESKVWSVPFDLTDTTHDWSVALDSPSRPTWRVNTAHVYVGACTSAACTDGQLVQLDSTADWSVASTRSVALGQSSWLGGVTIDDFASPPVAHFGSASGRVYTVEVPLP